MSKTTAKPATKTAAKNGPARNRADRVALKNRTAENRAAHAKKVGLK